MPKIIATKKDWIKLGFKLFAENGITGINVEKMSSKLKCNKSSFYWYFQTKKTFIDSIVEYWILTETDQIISSTNEQKTIEEKFQTFLALAFEGYPYLDFIFHLKRYAQKQKRIQKIIDKIDNQRLEFTEKLFQEMGYSKKDSNIKASIFYKYLIGYHEMIKNKKQNKNYLTEVKKELSHFLVFKNK